MAFKPYAPINLGIWITTMQLNKENPSFVKKVTNVHNDDIHGIVVLNEKYFVSGSKDTTVKLFSTSPVVMKKQLSIAPEASYGQWVTALDAFPDSSILIGHRNGYLLCKSAFNGKTYEAMRFPPRDVHVKKEHQFYKPRNENRIMGIKTLINDVSGKSYTALIGTPEAFYHYDFESHSILGNYRFAKPEWVYGFAQVSANKVVTIHGANLSLFHYKIDAQNLSQWQCISPLVQEPAHKKDSQRPFISSVFSMEPGFDAKRLALSLFGGETKVIDIETSSELHANCEHQLRVWQTVPFSPNEYISCSDDATIKVWDIRRAKSVFTYENHPGRVSSVAVLEGMSFVAGTCADESFKDIHKGQFYFYDIRKSKGLIEKPAAAAAPSKANLQEEADTGVEEVFEQLSVEGSAAATACKAIVPSKSSDALSHLGFYAKQPVINPEKHQKIHPKP